MKNILILLALIFVMLQAARAETFNMRRCALLPITDDLNGSIGFGVFEKLESYLKTSTWCTYQSNTSLVDVFNRYNRNLEGYLSDPKVLKTVSEKLQVGSLIRVKIKYEVDQVLIYAEVIGENGEDIYLSEKQIVKRDETDLMYHAVRGWLERYAEFIPYDGKVIGVLGNQVTIEIGKNQNPEINQEFVVKRASDKKQHKLLKTVVSWETETLGSGTLQRISEKHAFGTLDASARQSRVDAGDWVVLGNKAEDYVKDEPEIQDDHSYGYLGYYDIYARASSLGVASSMNTGDKKVKGFQIGFGVAAEAWITREYFVIGEFSKDLGKLKHDSGQMDRTDYTSNNTVFKIGGGYKFLPMGFFFGPQINVYGGYARYGYDYDKSSNDGIGSHAIGGLFIGVSGNMPIDNRYRIFGKAEMIPFSSFKDDDDIFGSSDSVSSLLFELGASYQYTRKVSFKGSLEFLNNRAKLKDEPSEITDSQTALKFAGSFMF